MRQRDDFARRGRRRAAARTSAGYCPGRTATSLMLRRCARTLTSPAWKLRSLPSSGARAARRRRRCRARCPACVARRAVHAHVAPGQRIERGVARQERRQAFAVELRPAPAAGAPARPRRCALRDGVVATASACQVDPGLVDVAAAAVRHAHVEAEADHRAHRPGVLAAAFDQQAAELAQPSGRRPPGRSAISGAPGVTERVQRFRRGDAGDQAQAAQPRQAAAELRATATDTGAPPAATPRRARGGRGRRSGARPAARRRRARASRAQQFAVGRVDRPGHSSA